MASDPEFRTASPAALVTSDSETSPATTVALDGELRAASPAAQVTSDVKPPEMNWLQAAKGSRRQATPNIKENPRGNDACSSSGLTTRGA